MQMPKAVRVDGVGECCDDLRGGGRGRGAVSQPVGDSCAHDSSV